MIKLISAYLSNLLALYIATFLFVQGIVLDATSLIMAALVLTILNYFLRPLLMVVALPLNLISLGFFVLLINAWMVRLADISVKGWGIQGFWTYMVTGALVLIFNILRRRIGHSVNKRQTV